jgi:hypothetical protein
MENEAMWGIFNRVLHVEKDTSENVNLCENSEGKEELNNAR